jgi:thymidine kinase
MITLILGEMWSGKTSELIRRIDRARYAEQPTIVYKYSNDTRYVGRSALVSSHSSLSREAVPVSSFRDVDVPTGMVVGIDEGQFIDGLVEFCEAAADSGCYVIVSALSSDFQRNGFPRITALIPKAEELVRLHAVCFVCKKEASFTKRIVDGSEVEIIGGKESYMAVCRKCWNQ